MTTSSSNLSNLVGYVPRDLIGSDGSSDGLPLEAEVGTHEHERGGHAKPQQSQRQQSSERSLQRFAFNSFM